MDCLFSVQHLCIHCLAIVMQVKSLLILNTISSMCLLIFNIISSMLSDYSLHGLLKFIHIYQNNLALKIVNNKSLGLSLQA